MFNTQMNENYQRDDIYYCDCCAEFYDIKTHELVNLKISDIPLDMALLVLAARKKLKGNNHHHPKTRRKHRGFDR